MSTTVRKATVSANRYSGGASGDGFWFNLFDADTNATITFRMTPEQWALAMWGRGDIAVDVEWTNAAPTGEVVRAEEWTPLASLPPGTLFVTKNGGQGIKLAVAAAEPECVRVAWLSGGEMSTQTGGFLVRRIPLPEASR